MCAGAVGSPHLLLLSGIGPAGQLRALGIDPAADLPGVGAEPPGPPRRPGLLRHARAAAPQPVQPRRDVRRAAQPAGRRLPGPAPVPHPAARRPRPGASRPPPGYALVAAVVAPDSRGTVQLATADPQMAPVINPGFLRDGRDLDRLEAGLVLIRQAAASLASFSRVRAAEAHPGPASPPAPGCAPGSGARSAATGTRPAPAGSGADTDPDAVVDPQLRVRGITGLRVADASVMPVIPNAPLNATVLAIAEKAASLITGRD